MTYELLQDDMKPYFCYEGILKLAHELKGNENVYLGIRPYGFHAGNMSTLVAYPLLLCQELARLGKIPKLNVFLFINDWEQEKLDGVNPTMYPFNVLPKGTTWQFIPDPIDKKLFIADFWEPIIVNYVRLINYYFPQTSLQTIRNSHMKTHPIMKKCLLKTIKNPKALLKILRENTNKPTLDHAIYASAVCPKCKTARGNTKVIRTDYIVFTCSHCKLESKGKYELFEYWFYHKPLALPRIEAYNIDLTVTDCGKYKEGDFLVRQKLMEAYHIKKLPPKTLFAPVILGKNNKIMGKSKGNAISINLDKLLQLLINNPKAETIKIPELT